MRLTILVFGALLLLSCGRAVPPPSPTATATFPVPPPLTTPTLAATPSQTPRPIASPTATLLANESPLYLPVVGVEVANSADAYPYPPPIATPRPTDTPTPSPTPTPTLDFAAIRAQLQSQGQDLEFVKVGFHTSLGGSQEGLDSWMRRLDAAGVPIFLKSVDNAEPLYRAQEMMKESGRGVPHILVYRRSGNEYDVPRYDLPPAEAARLHWQLHVSVFPPELDPNLVWIETINEPDKNRAEWLAEFALVTAELALADGYKWAAFGWASGEPELVDWQSPAMLRFLALAGQHPDRLAIALHEYSYLAEDIRHEFPYKVGRFRFLFEAADQHGLPRPTVLITEWGWAYQHIPPPAQALADVAWAAELYAPYPEIKGIAIWHLGGGYADIAYQVQPLIAPLTEYALGHYFVVE